MIRGDFLSFFLFFFFSFAPLRRTRNALLLDLLITKRDIICCIYIFFLEWVSGVCVYMWILIRDHGRLRVPRQAKFLSCKYWGFTWAIN